MTAGLPAYMLARMAALRPGARVVLTRAGGTSMRDLARADGSSGAGDVGRLGTVVRVLPKGGVVVLLDGDELDDVWSSAGFHAVFDVLEPGAL